MGGTAPHTFNQPPDQWHVPLRTDFAAQPQAGTDHHGKGHPDNTTLLFDPDLIGLHLSQVTRLFDQMLLHRLSLGAGACRPPCYRPLIIAKRDDNRLEGTSVGQQRHRQAHCLRRGAQAIECRAFRGTERLVALCTEEALVLARVDTNVAPASLSSGGARQIGAECRGGVHACVLRVTLGNVPRGVCLDPYFHCKHTIPRLAVELPWSKHVTNSPFLALLAMPGSQAACKISSACSH